MKVYIQSNRYQLIAANVAKYSFERFGCKVNIMDAEKNELLKKSFNKNIIRNKKTITYKDDLQSFTLLRFLAPQLDNYKNKILVIDPDIFALKNPKDLYDKFVNETINIVCTYYGESPRSEMMMINANKVSWKFEKIVEDLFNLQLDYSDLMKLKFDNSLVINKIENKYNSHDKLDENTVLLHTTSRITQPWKIGLNVDFERHYTKKYLIKENIKRLMSMKYNYDALSKKYIMHKNKLVFETICKLFKEAYKSNYITKEMLNLSIDNNYISKEFCEMAEII
tara:strand:+ start:1538 stop:2380 length:843 start_codon:yes stop_codon:yes gene_type:complete